MADEGLWPNALYAKGPFAASPRTRVRHAAAMKVTYAGLFHGSGERIVGGGRLSWGRLLQGNRKKGLSAGSPLTLRQGGASSGLLPWLLRPLYLNSKNFLLRERKALFAAAPLPRRVLPVLLWQAGGERLVGGES